MLHLGPGEVAVAIVDRLELAAVDGHEGVGEQVEVATQDDELATDQANGYTIALAKVCDGLEIWRQPSGQSHQFYIALGFALQPSTRMHPVEVTVDE